MRRRAGLVGLLSLLAAAPAAPGRVEHDVAPAVTDPAIGSGDSNDVAAYIPARGEHGRLLVFFGGATSLDASASWPFLAEAMARHYRLVLVDYRYDPPGTVLCGQRPDPCFERYRRAKVFGGSPMPGLDVSQAESLASRTASLLRHLARTYPAEHWDRYLAAGLPCWRDIAVSGFSQGAGLAAFLARHVAVARVILLSSPWDHDAAAGTVAGWLSQPSATPPDRWWGMYAAHEQAAPWMARTYAALGLAPAHVRIVTDRPACPKRPGLYLPNHWSVAVRACTPRGAAGAYLEAPLWDAMLGTGE